LHRACLLCTMRLDNDFQRGGHALKGGAPSGAGTTVFGLQHIRKQIGRTWQ
jgi:hypothetical protein